MLLRLVFPAQATATVLVGVDDAGAALSLRDAILEAGLTLEAAELMTDDGLDLVCAEKDLRYPFDDRAAYTVLLEVSGPDDPEGRWSRCWRAAPESSTGRWRRATPSVCGTTAKATPSRPRHRR